MRKQRFLNLDLEVVEMAPLDLSGIEKQFIKANIGRSDLSSSAMHEWALNNPESLAKLFEEQVAPFFENALTLSDKIYVQTKEMLRFYRHHFR